MAARGRFTGPQAGRWLFAAPAKAGGEPAGNMLSQRRESMAPPKLF